MLKLKDKIEILKTYLYDIKDNYADSFKTDIFFTLMNLKIYKTWILGF